jgi:stigma-specific protein Stig1
VAPYGARLTNAFPALKRWATLWRAYGAPPHPLAPAGSREAPMMPKIRWLSRRFFSCPVGISLYDDANTGWMYSMGMEDGKMNIPDKLRAGLFIALAFLLLSLQMGAQTTPSCEAGKSMCDGRCVDVTKSPRNCGACGRACEPGQKCVAGACSGTASCAAGKTMCPKEERCVDLSKNPKNCGGCGHACKPGQKCLSGQCSG